MKIRLFEPCNLGVKNAYKKRVGCKFQREKIKSFRTWQKCLNYMSNIQ